MTPEARLELEVDPSAMVHSSAVVELPALIGARTRIWHFVHVMAGARIGEDCSLGQGCHVGSAAIIGRGVRLQNGVSVFDGVTLEDGVFCGPGAVFTNVRYPRAHVSRRDEYEKTLVRRGATIGANATVLPGVTIGCFALVGAGAVVTRDVAAFALVLGSPAREAGFVSRRGEPLSFDAAGNATCAITGEKYRRDERGEVTAILPDGSDPP